MRSLLSPWVVSPPLSWCLARVMVGGGKGGANNAEWGSCGCSAVVFAHGYVHAWSCAGLLSWSLPYDAAAARI